MPERVRSAILGGLGMSLIEGVGLPERIADALEAPSIDDVSGEQARTFRAFAEQTKSDRRALAACIRGSRQTLTRAQAAAIRVPMLIAVGTKDTIAGSAEALGGADPGRAGCSPFRSATTCSRSATRCSWRPCWHFSPSGRDPREAAMQYYCFLISMP